VLVVANGAKLVENKQGKEHETNRSKSVIIYLFINKFTICLLLKIHAFNEKKKKQREDDLKPSKTNKTKH
jgi:hypothetical protein